MLPRKGTRRIVLDGRIFTWRASHVVHSDGDRHSHDIATVTIRSPEGVLRTMRFDAGRIGVVGYGLKYQQLLPITPRLIRALILEIDWTPAGPIEVAPSEAAYALLRDHPDTGKTGTGKNSVFASVQPGRYQR